MCPRAPALTFGKHISGKQEMTRALFGCVPYHEKVLARDMTTQIQVLRVDTNEITHSSKMQDTKNTQTSRPNDARPSGGTR